MAECYWKPLTVPVYPQRNAMVLIMFQEPLKPGLTDAVHVQKHFFAHGLRLIEKAVRWNSFFSVTKAMHFLLDTTVQLSTGVMEI